MACSSTRMIASGIPDTTVLVIGMKELKQSVEDLKHNNAEMQDRIINNIDEMINTLKREFPTLIADVILDRVQVTGAREVTKDILENAIDGLKRHFTELLQSTLNHMRQSIQTNSIPSSENATPHDGSVFEIHDYRIHKWLSDELHHFFPENYHINGGMKMKTLWDMWWLGSPAEQIGPLRFVVPTLDIRKLERNLFSKAKQVIFEYRGAWKNENGTPLEKMTSAQLDEAFDLCTQKMFSDPSKIGSLCITTVYNHFH